MAGDFIEGVDPQVAKARRENYEIMQGEVCIPRDFDNHAVHIEEHNAERLSARYERATPDLQHVMDQHVQAHSTMAAEEAGQQAMKMQYAPALAAAVLGQVEDEAVHRRKVSGVDELSADTTLRDQPGAMQMLHVEGQR